MCLRSAGWQGCAAVLHQSEHGEAWSGYQELGKDNHRDPSRKRDFCVVLRLMIAVLYQFSCSLWKTQWAFPAGAEGGYECVCTYSITNITCTYTVTIFEVRPIFLWWMPNYFLNPIFLCQSKSVSATSLPPLIRGKGMPPFMGGSGKGRYKDPDSTVTSEGS